MTASTPLRARTIEELHLFLDLAGWVPERRHVLEESPAGLRVVYSGQIRDGAPVEAVFAPVPALPETAPSRLLDAGQWKALATRLAQSVPGRPDALTPPARDRLAQAIRYLDEVLRFAVPGVERLPDAAFWSRDGKALRDERPGAFDVSMLEAERSAWSRLLKQSAGRR